MQEIQSNAFAFAALRADGSVVTWGEDWMGGDSSSVRSELQDVLRIYSRRHSGMFAAIKTRGRIVFWGNAAHFGEINTGLSNIAHFIYAGGRWAAASEDGSLALSFRSIDGERCMQVPDCALKLVQCLDCIAILQKNGEVLFWGRAVPEWLRSELKNVAQLRVTRNASECAAIRSDGSVATWRFRSTGVHAGCATDSSQPAKKHQKHTEERLWLCCFAGRWFCRDLGHKQIWWQQCRREDAAEGCGMHSGEQPGLRGGSS